MDWVNFYSGEHKLNTVFAYPFALPKFTILMTFQGRGEKRARNTVVTRHHSVKGSLYTKEIKQE